MHDARDAEDIRLLHANEYAELLATYYPVVVERCRLRLPDADAYAVASDVAERLLTELRAGKTYSVPFRVVVHKVTDWKLKEFSQPRRVDFLPEDWDAAGPDPYAEFVAEYDFETWIAPLPERTQEALRLRHFEGLEAAEVGERLGINANAAHQLIWRGHEKLRESAHD
jgi:RNA polymerase sigma factor (sigma-70 family)